MDFTVALAQIKPKLGCVADNLALAEAAVADAVNAGAGLVLFPELALTGYFLKDLVPDVALSLDAPEIIRLKELSRHIAIVIGCVEVSSDYRFFNSALYFDGGELRHVHRKVYLPTYGMFDEQRYLARGERFRAFDSRFGRLGILICEDMWHLSAPYVLAMDGATTLLCLSSSPGRGVSEDESLGSTSAWQKLTATTAMFFNCRVLYCNRVGYEDGVSFWGGSEVVSPAGSVTARGKLFEDDLVMARIEEGELRRERIFSPLMRDESLSVTLKELERIDRERGC
ncbi:nitrilase-related carbon-nitrogen hydrolase [Geobacter sp. AOG1]|uniref:nitrilase-related carbon-nitrogen hydrolase n=1 Tax=Geobacter sp. AOG1 TaxID=1566346 RepID=UPI001CC557B0|nr:nitrilase-related carbon-nitrogen hydrolase [Geobacter sp. AOG1]GFE57797.1 carbon-nitrogen hydrolase [Geobacter sp. AOG1]